ncbi:MAG TPA: helix-turn-helix transcriptional regulator [Nocardioides sp.]|nr:helix-turn-helix transcriptional regulator [Nocardioides sp.]
MEVVAPTTVSPADVALAALRSAREVVACDGAALMVLDPATHLPFTGAVDEMPQESCHPFFAFELGDHPRTFRRMALDRSPADRIHADDAPEDPLVATMLVPHGFAAEIRAVCRDAQAAWGGITLVRRPGARPFTPVDQDRIDRFAAGVGKRLRAAVVGSLERPGGGPVPTLAAGSLGVLVVEHGTVVEVSPEVTEVLRELGHPTPDEYRHLDLLRALARDEAPFTTVLRTPLGWLTAHGTPLSEGRVAIALSAAGPERLLGTRVVAAGLSAREVEVTRLLCRGLTDREIARELGVSEHTAHDHVRSVRGKLGVRSRAEVSATIFAERYFEEFLGTAAVTHA